MSDIATVQQLLQNHGFNPGPIDGKWGPQSQRALVAALQAAMGAKPADPEDQALLEELDQDEGIRAYAYEDSKGYLTIGRGRLVDRRLGGGLSPDEIDYLTRNDLRRVDADLDRNIPWWRGKDPVRRRVLRNLCFNMGWGNGERGLSSFRNTLAAFEAGDYERAAVGLAASKWAKDVQASRRDRILRQVRTGA